MAQRAIILLLLLTCAQGYVHAQKEATNWVFGGFGGVNFTCATPQLMASPFDGLEGGSCISSASGELLMITNGDAVWDRDYHLMPNGRGLGGLCTYFGNYSSASQSALIVPHPGNANQYYIFTTDCAEDAFAAGLRYSIVDLSLNGGKGSVIEKNKLLQVGAEEKVAAVFQPNGKDVWVVTHGVQSNEFYAFSFTAAGLNKIPVVSAVGQVHPGGRGYMKFSPDGQRLAVSSFLFGGNDGIQPELFKFDKVTGRFTSDFVLPTNSNTIYALSFSPNGKILYASCAWTCTPANVEQYNLEAGTPQEIVNQRYTISAPGIFGAMQLSVDGRLYFMTFEEPIYEGYLSVVTEPNTVGAACQYRGSYIKLTCGIGSSWGLSNFIESYFETPVTPAAQCPTVRKDLIDVFDFTAMVDCATREVSFQNISEVIDIGQGVPQPTMQWKFDFGDNSDTRTPDIAPVSHTYARPGEYNVTLSVYVSFNSCPARTITHKVIIPSPGAAGFKTVQDCQSPQVDFVNETLTQGPVQWKWNFGDNSPDNTSTIQHPSHRYARPGTYTVKLEVTGSACGDAVKEQQVKVYDPLNVSLGPDATFCFATLHTLTATAQEDASYLWSHGATSQETMVTTPGEYSVTLTRDNCSVSDQVQLSYRECALCNTIVHDLHIGSDTIICETDAAHLKVNDWVIGEFLWSDGSTARYLNALQPGKYWLTLTQGNCMSKDTVTVDTRDCTVCDVFIPNVVTPNEDEKNDDFVVNVACEHYAFHMDVFNRWGRKVCSSEDPSWNGRIDNDIAPSGIYYYVVQYSFTGPQSRVITHQKKGWINVLN